MSYTEQYQNPTHTAHLVWWLRMDQNATFSTLERLLHLFKFDGKMSFKVPAQGHAGVLPSLATGKDLIVTQEGSLVFQV